MAPQVSKTELQAAALRTQNLKRLEALGREALKDPAPLQRIQKFQYFLRREPHLLWDLFREERDAVCARFLRGLTKDVPASKPSVPASKPSTATSTQRAATLGVAREAVAGAVRRSILDTFYINGRPVGDALVAEAREWSESHAVRAKFVGLLVAGLPDTGRIRDYISDDDAEILHRKVSAFR